MTRRPITIAACSIRPKGSISSQSTTLPLPQQAEPLLARALSYLALDRPREAASDLDEAVQSDPQNVQAWITRGLAYERLGDKNKAAGSYGRAINLRPKDEAARIGFARVGGKPGQSYETF